MVTLSSPGRTRFNPLGFIAPTPKFWESTVGIKSLTLPEVAGKHEDQRLFMWSSFDTRSDKHGPDACSEGFIYGIRHLAFRQLFPAFAGVKIKRLPLKSYVSPQTLQSNLFRNSKPKYLANIWLLGPGGLVPTRKPT